MRLHGWRDPRLAQGRASDVAFCGQVAVCLECKRNRATIRERYTALCASLGDRAADDERVTRLKEELDGASYKWSTYNTQFVKFLGERYSFMTALFPFTISHRAALQHDVTIDIVRAARPSCRACRPRVTQGAIVTLPRAHLCAYMCAYYTPYRFTR